MKNSIMDENHGKKVDPRPTCVSASFLPCCLIGSPWGEYCRQCAHGACFRVLPRATAASTSKPSDTTCNMWTPPRITQQDAGTTKNYPATCRHHHKLPSNMQTPPQITHQHADTTRNYPATCRHHQELPSNMQTPPGIIQQHADTTRNYPATCRHHQELPINMHTPPGITHQHAHTTKN